MTLIAKTIVPDKFWVVVDTTGKVGNIDRTQSGEYSVRINGENQQHTFDSKIDVEKQYNIKFVNADGKKLSLRVNITDLPCDGEVYNTMIDITRKLYLFTKTEDSKCYYASGWFALYDTDTREYEYVLCPKYIFLQRRNFLGPFYTKQQAIDASVSPRATKTNSIQLQDHQIVGDIVVDKYYNE